MTLHPIEGIGKDDKILPHHDYITQERETQTIEVLKHFRLCFGFILQ